jgi:hypothetical protein
MAAKGVISPQRLGFLFRANLVILLILAYHVVMLILPLFSDMSESAAYSSNVFGSPMIQSLVRVLCILTLLGCITGSFFNRWDIFLGLLFFNVLILVFSLGEDLNALKELNFGIVDYTPEWQYK